MNREIEARQRNYATVNLFSVRKFSSENDQVSHSRWSTLDKINGGPSCRAVVSEGRLRQSNLSNLSYIYYRTGYGISRSVAQTDADNRFKLTPRRWIRGERSFLITRWELCLPWSNRCSINISSNFFFLITQPTFPSAFTFTNKFLIDQKLQEQFVPSIVFHIVDYGKMKRRAIILNIILQQAQD